MTARDVLDGIKAGSAGLMDLCAEHLRQSIRHVQRNCDIDCNTHEDTWDDCKQPERGDGERMAAALASIPRLTAAVDAVLALHEREVIAVFAGYGEEGWCPRCKEHWPCQTVAAIENALEGDQ
jgi:hypothetical protein